MKLYGRRDYIDEDGATDNGDQCNYHDDGIPPIRQLEAFLDKWSSNTSLDRSEADTLSLIRVVITRPLIHRLLPLLPHDEDDDYMDQAASTTSSDTPVLKFNHVSFFCCCFCSEADATMPDNDDDVCSEADELMEYNDDDVCTPDDKVSFLSAIARLRDRLFIGRSRDILSGLLSFPEIDHLEVQNLNLFQHTQVPESEFVSLGAMIQRSVQTTHVTLTIYLEDVPQEFYDCLANSIHIQELRFGDLRNLYLWWSPQDINKALSKLITGEDGNGAVERLLRNPQSQLTSLNLDNTYLEDHRLIALAQLLPSSRVESFSFRNNCIHAHGLLEFLQQIPKMHSLNNLFFTSNPWEKEWPTGNPWERMWEWGDPVDETTVDDDNPWNDFEVVGEFLIVKLIGSRDNEDGVTDYSQYNEEEQAEEVRDIPPMVQLDALLETWSSSTSLDRSGAKEIILYLQRLVITRPLIHRLLPLLRHDDQDDNINHSAGTTSSDTPILKVKNVVLDCCCFCSEADITIEENYDDDVCTPDDKLSFFSAIARLRGMLYIGRSRDILSGLMSVPEIDHLESLRFGVIQKSRIPESEFVRLGTMIQRSVQTTHVTLRIEFEDVPQEFYDCLANSTHIQELWFWGIGYNLSTSKGNALTSKLVVGGDGNGAVERLLRNPQSQLISLELGKTYLDEHHLLALGQLLSNSNCKLEKFSFEGSRISLQILLEFLRQIPQMHSLRELWGECDDEESEVEDIDCGAALLDGFMKNPSLTRVNTWIKYPTNPLLIHYQSLNCGGRKILASYQPQSQAEDQPTRPVPDGLWPHILARAGRPELYEIPELWLEHNGPANAVFFFLQHCPNILSKRANNASLSNESTMETIVEDESPPQESTVDDENPRCRAALLLLDCVIKNPSITYVDSGFTYPINPLLVHYLSLNCGGRKILASYQPQSQGEAQPTRPIPDGLWPHILARAGRRELYASPEILHGHNGPANAVFFFLQHCPNVLSCYH